MFNVVPMVQHSNIQIPVFEYLFESETALAFISYTEDGLFQWY